MTTVTKKKVKVSPSYPPSTFCLTASTLASPVGRRQRPEEFWASPQMPQTSAKTAAYAQRAPVQIRKTVTNRSVAL